MKTDNKLFTAAKMLNNLAMFRKWLLSKPGWKALAGLGALGVLWLTGMLDAVMEGFSLLTESDGFSWAMAIVGGVAGAGSHVEGEPLTTAVAEEAAPGLLRNEIDSRIVKIRPMSTPLDQISRYGGARVCRSMKVEYYSVDTKPVKAVVTTAFTAPDDRSVTGDTSAHIAVDQPRVFQRSTTVLVPSVKSSEGDPLVLYVLDSDNNGVTFLPVNNRNTNGYLTVPSMPKDTVLVRMGRAAAELDVTTPQFEALPRKDHNLCQIFK